MAGLDDRLCPTHGWRAHAFTHEAAHAVAALDQGLEFERVIVLAPGTWLPREGRTGTVAGGVEFAPTVVELVTGNPDAALAVLAAGGTAEEVVYDHHMDEAFDGDLRVWGLGAAELGMTPLGAVERFVRARVEARTWVRSSLPRIEKVAAALAGDHGPFEWIPLFNRGPWELSSDEVVAAVGSEDIGGERTP